MTRIAVSVAVAVFTVLLFTVLPRVGSYDASLSSTIESEAGALLSPVPPRSFHATRREAMALAHRGLLADAVAVGTEALRIGEKSFSEDREVTREALDSLANTIERWYLRLD